MSLLRSMVVGVVLLSAANTSFATVLDFNALPMQWFGNSFIDVDGYRITSTGSSLTTTAVGSTLFCSPRCPDNGGNYLMANGAGFEITSLNGSSFSLLDFDGAEVHAGSLNALAEDIEVTATTSGGLSVSQLFTLDWINDGDGPLVDFQNFIASNIFSDLVSVRFEGIGASNTNRFTADNFNLVAVSVPEPASLALMGLGLVGLGFARRKKAA